MARIFIFSTDTGDLRILSSTLEAETTTSCPKTDVSVNSTERVDIPLLISTSLLRVAVRLGI